MENILNNLLANQNSKNEGENRIAKVFLASEEAKLLTEIRSELDAFRSDKGRAVEGRKGKGTNTKENKTSQVKNETKENGKNSRRKEHAKDTEKAQEQANQPEKEDPPSDNESESSDDSFFGSDSDDGSDNESDTKRTKTKSKPDRNFTQDLNLDYLKNSRFSLDKKRNYQEKRDIFNKEKEVEKIKNKSLAHTRNHGHLLKSEEKLHPSWQAKIASKRKLEAMKEVKNKRISFGSDSE